LKGALKWFKKKIQNKKNFFDLATDEHPLLKKNLSKVFSLSFHFKWMLNDV